MKKCLFILVLVAMLPSILAAQNAVKYTYDQSGNRVVRNSQSTPEAPQWLATGNTRCVTNANNQNTGYQQREERDNSPSSATYNQLRWVNSGFNSTACPLSPINLVLKNVFSTSVPSTINISLEVLQNTTVIQTFQFPTTRRGSITVHIPPRSYQLKFTANIALQNIAIGYYLYKDGSQGWLSDWYKPGGQTITTTGTVIFNTGTGHTLTATDAIM